MRLAPTGKHYDFKGKLPAAFKGIIQTFLGIDWQKAKQSSMAKKSETIKVFAFNLLNLFSLCSHSELEAL